MVQIFYDVKSIVKIFQKAIVRILSKTPLLKQCKARQSSASNASKANQWKPQQSTQSNACKAKHNNAKQCKPKQSKQCKLLDRVALG